VLPSTIGSQVSAIFKLCSAVLALGNVDFTDARDGSVSFAKTARAQTVATLLGIDRGSLFRALAFRSVLVGVRRAEYQNSMAEARAVRDAAAACLYRRLFYWLVGRLNRTLRAPATDEPRAGLAVLDLYGFESMDTNGPCLDEGVLSLLSLICCSYGYSTYKQE
jgi:myosin-1